MADLEDAQLSLRVAAIDPAVSVHLSPAQAVAVTEEMDRLRAENARLRDPFTWDITWWVDSEPINLGGHGNLIELDHGIGQILVTHPDIPEAGGRVND